MRLHKYLLSIAAGTLICLCAGAKDGSTTQSSDSPENLSYGGLIPAPAHYTAVDGSFDFGDRVTVFLETDSSGADNLRTYIYQLPFGVRTVENADDAQVHILIDAETEIAEEGYRMKVEPEGVKILSKTAAGAFYAVQNLLQMTRWGETGRIPCCEISDEPRFPFRGLMFDCGRFRSPEFLMKQIDAMAMFKLNKMLLFLGSGYSFVVEKYPLVASRHVYTEDEIRQIIDYAALRNIDVIPIVQMPGHSELVLKAYPELACRDFDGRKTDLCIGKEATFDFLEAVVDKVVDLFKSEYIHIGGDEALKEAWRVCPDCRRRMQEEGLADVDELQSYLVRRIGRYIESKGRKMMGWDEIMEGGLAPNATVLSWRNTQAGVMAAQMGHDVIMTPTTYCYLDYYQDAPFKEPKAFGGYVPLSTAYSFDPSGANSLEFAEEPSEEAKPHILGLTGCLWATFMPTESSVEYMAYPRALAIAEVGWTPVEEKDYPDFKARTLAALDFLRQRGFTTFDLANEYGFSPKRDRPHKIGIAAHRGFWACEEGTFVHNSIASLRTAQEYGFWGSELDLHLTTDEVIVVFHDDKYHDIRIDANPYSEIESIPLKNGEKVPTLDDYLAQASKNPKMALVVEFKAHPTPEQEDRLIELTLEKLKEYDMYDPTRITFISFSRHACDVVAEVAPEFPNQYLDEDYGPDELAETGINGVDYEYHVFYDHPDWYGQARSHGMSVNCWTVDEREDIEKMIDLGVDFITTNRPLLVRRILSEKDIPEL